nr:MAG TPA: hypothetical protein [Caudoviricetes sp.]
MVTRVIQGSSEDAVKLGDKFISEGMPNSLAWGLVCSLITGTKTDATAIRTVLSQQEEDHYAALRAKRETKGSETAVAAESPKGDVKPAATTAAPVTEPAPAKPVAAEPAVAPKATETTAATATPVASGSPAAEGEGPKDPKPAAPTNSVTNSVLVGPSDHL